MISAVKLTPCICLVYLVCFGRSKNLKISGFVRDWHGVLQEYYTSILLSVVSLKTLFKSWVRFIPFVVDFVRYLTFWHHMIEI